LWPLAWSGKVFIFFLFLTSVMQAVGREVPQLLQRRGMSLSRDSGAYSQEQLVHSAMFCYSPLLMD
jgi:hypothetical protein